jgi:hypothetical protein
MPRFPNPFDDLSPRDRALIEEMARQARKLTEKIDWDLLAPLQRTLNSADISRWIAAVDAPIVDVAPRNIALEFAVGTLELKRPPTEQPASEAQPELLIQAVVEPVGKVAEGDAVAPSFQRF